MNISFKKNKWRTCAFGAKDDTPLTVIKFVLICSSYICPIYLSFLLCIRWRMFLLVPICSKILSDFVCPFYPHEPYVVPLLTNFKFKFLLSVIFWDQTSDPYSKTGHTHISNFYLRLLGIPWSFQMLFSWTILFLPFQYGFYIF